MNRFAMVGAFGRMGRAIIELSFKSSAAVWAAAVERPQHPQIGKNIAVDFAFGADSFSAEIAPKEIKLISFADANIAEALAEVDAFIDFSSPQSSLQMLETASRLNKAAVIGTTGWSEQQKEQVQAYAQKIPLVLSANMSVGVNALFALTRMAAKMLVNKGYDPEILEIHHNQKKDAPSGTAKTLESIVLQEADWPKQKVLYGREGLIGKRDSQELGVMSLRGGDVTGEHTVYFFGEGERLELKHLATSREIFAKGALLALDFVCKKRQSSVNGLFSMQDILEDLLA